jgi:hypothetical protein
MFQLISFALKICVHPDPEERSQSERPSTLLTNPSEIFASGAENQQRNNSAQFAEI